jgi:Tfp pilus assembly protein PilV
MLTRDRGGFSLIEVCIAIVILTAAVLGLAASSGSMLSPVNDAETEFAALQYVEDRLTEVRLDPRYSVLDSIYGTTETTLLGLPGARRETTFARTRTAEPNGKWVDYWTVVVTVSGGRLRQPVVRKLIVAAP